MALSLRVSQYVILATLALGLLSCSNGGDGTSNDTEPTNAAATTISFDTKVFRFSWTDVSDATHYKLFENADGLSGFTQVGSDIPQGTESIDHSVALYARVNASYMLQSCNAAGCSDDNTLFISGTLVDAIGYFKASNTGANDFFGNAVSISADGDTLAVGAKFEDSSTTGVNSVPNDDGTANSSGAVYVFTRTGTTWSLQAYLKANNTDQSDYFGTSVSISADGTALAVGADGEDSASTGVNSVPNDNGTATNSGAVYVFRRTGTTWNQQAYLKASNPGDDDLFGQAVSISADGTALVVGAYGEDSATTGVNSTPDANGIASNSGAVYVFTRTASTWSQQAYLKASNTDANDSFGFSVSINADGDILAVGAYREDSATTGVNSVPNDNGTAINSGAVYVFSRTAGTWNQQAYLKASNTGSGDAFGQTVSISTDGESLAVGAYGEDSATTGINSTPADNGTATNSGAVYVFTLTASTWSQQAYLKASNSDADDYFSRWSLSISADGNTLAVGAVGEDSETTGVNSVPNDDGTANFSGAVYVFSRTTGIWSQQAYLKTSTTSAGDQFGYSVSISADGGSLAVGAHNEDGATTGIDSTPNDDGTADDSGAVYLF